MFRIFKFRAANIRDLRHYFQLSVDGTNGNVALDRVDATYAQTEVDAKGSVANAENYTGKLTALDFAVSEGAFRTCCDFLYAKGRFLSRA